MPTTQACLILGVCKNLNEFKRSTYKKAYNRAGEKILDDVERAIGDVVRQQLEDDLKGLKIAGAFYAYVIQRFEAKAKPVFTPEELER